ncbi:MAG: DUF1638 domain-containing protein [Chloroflexi bacterium]|nr:MAG: DUF1638 domain-containing protein [Chloroflexota bacterium]
MTTALIICGALAREVLDIVNKHDWDAQVFGIPALDHMFPERIAPDVEKKFLQIKADHERTVVVFGDCGSRGALDAMLEKHQLERIDGPHCYEMYGGTLFQDLMDEEPGTFFLTDFLVRGFEGLVVKGMGLDRFPHLKKDYFYNYRRLVYFVQNESSELVEKAREVADYLELPLEIRVTGYGLLEERLVAMMANTAVSPSNTP